MSAATRAKPGTAAGRRSDQWEAIVINGEAGLSRLCALVREAWALGRDYALDGRITFRQPARGPLPGQLPLPEGEFAAVESEGAHGE